MSFNIVDVNLQSYLLSGFDNIEGWCDRSLFYTVDLISRADINKNGGCCE